MPGIHDARTPGYDLLYPPGEPLAVELHWPPDTLDGRGPWTAFLDDVELDVTVNGDVLEITADEATLEPVPDFAHLQLLDDDNLALIGRWVKSSAGASSPFHTRDVIVDDTTVEVAVIGPPGPPGPPGPSGTGAHHVHTQATPAVTWTVNHDLGYPPSVQVILAGGESTDGVDITHIDDNSLTVGFGSAQSGKVACS